LNSIWRPSPFNLTFRIIIVIANKSCRELETPNEQECDGQCIASDEQCHGKCGSVKPKKCGDKCLPEKDKNFRECDGACIPSAEQCNGECGAESPDKCGKKCIDNKNSAYYDCDGECFQGRLTFFLAMFLEQKLQR
jgi:hypothetical protein